MQQLLATRSWDQQVQVNIQTQTMQRKSSLLYSCLMESTWFWEPCPDSRGRKKLLTQGEGTQKLYVHKAMQNVHI